MYSTLAAISESFVNADFGSVRRSILITESELLESFDLLLPQEQKKIITMNNSVVLMFR
jgi:hypothetical protein